MIARALSRPAAVRLLGLIGAVCCAIDGFLFGAPAAIRWDVSVVSILRGPHGALIMLLWVLGLAALCTAWWYGRHLLARGLLTRRWILLTAALWILPMLVIPPLASRDVYAYACQGALFDAGFNPYVDSVSSQPCPWLESVSVRWRTTPTPYGPVFVVLAGLAARLGSLTAAVVAFRVLAVLAVALLAWALVLLARRLDVAAEKPLWWVLCCPLIPVHIVGGAHNDALTVAFLVAGLAMVTGGSRRPGVPVTGGPRRSGALVAGGVLIGLSVAVKTTMVVALPFAALIAAGGPALFAATGLLPRPGGMASLLRHGGTVIGAALGTLLVVSYASGLGLGWTTALSGAGESVSWTSPPTAVGITVDAVGRWFGVELGAVPVARAAALALMLVALAGILWRSRTGDPLYGIGLAFLTVIVLAPITQPWYLLWPVALIAVTPVRARWLAGTIVASMFLILPNGDGAWKPLQVPLSFAMTALLGWLLYRGVAWTRGRVTPTVDDAGPGADDGPGADGAVAVGR